MNGASAKFVIASGVQGGHARASELETLLIALGILALAVATALIFLYLRRRYRRPRPVGDQWQALAVMGELCPHGWQAQITLRGWDAPVPVDAPPSRVPMVELEWTQFEEGADEVALTRRVWTPTIGEGLQTMVENRRTDVALEQTEGAAGEDDQRW